jgi:hypothetical protein
VIVITHAEWREASVCGAPTGQQKQKPVQRVPPSCLLIALPPIAMIESL